MACHNLVYLELDEVMRQKDVEFSTILIKTGDGKMVNKEERALLETPFRKP